MRSLIAVTLALLAGGCDRQSPPAAQGNAADAAATIGSVDEVPPPAPDEAPARTGGARPGTFDASHKGTPAPEFALTDLAGKPLTLAAFRGKPLLVNLWATWCAPCIKEMPTLDALAARERGLAVVAISQDMEPEKAKAFWAKGGYRAMAGALDPKLAFSTGYAVNLPTTILYDAAGKEVWRYTGSLDWAGAEAARALAAAPAAPAAPSGS